MLQQPTPCEGASRVDTCTIAAHDAITAFAVPNPNQLSQACRFFRVRLPSGLPLRVDHPAYFGLAIVSFDQPFQPSTGHTVNTAQNTVNAHLWCRMPSFGRKIWVSDAISTLPEFVLVCEAANKCGQEHQMQRVGCTIFDCPRCGNTARHSAQSK